VSWRGLDNASYYRLVPGEARHYVNDTGCGNTLDLSHPRVLQMVLDSLRYWVEAYHVDGFRFDLASTLAREPGGFDPGSGFFDAIQQDPVLSRVKRIAEPWDLGPGGYQVGNFPPGFAEWNDKFRDTVRRYWRGDSSQRGDLARRLSGSADLFDRRHRKPWASINFITAHDGFTLADLVSYGRKHNEANGEDNRDGTNDNASANWSPDGSVEGSTDDPGIRTTRARVARALISTLLLSRGTPMLTAGDEWGRSQQGNNNAYCQDSPLSWLDWDEADSDAGRTMIACVRRLLALRRRLPALLAREYAHGGKELLPGLRDIDWFGANGESLTPEQWSAPEDRTLALRWATRTERGSVPVTLLLLNAGGSDATFTLPAPLLSWAHLFDSTRPEAPEAALEGNQYTVPAHALVLLFALAAFD
jgi:glycogen operon protein